MKKLWKYVFYSIGILFVSFIYLGIASRTTTFLLPYVYGQDSGIFQLIGKGWGSGLIPYINLLDHKGPFIFFVEYMGYFIHGRSGVFFLQIVSLSITLVGIWRCFSLQLSEKKSFIISICILIFFSFYFSDGNTTEEFSMPFLVWSLYGILKYWKSRKTDKSHIEHPCRYAFFYGISFAVIFLIRVTNALLICVYVMGISISLIYHRKWKNFGQNICMFLLGCLIAFAPFAVYFIMHGAFGQMIYATIICNIKYTLAAKATHEFSLSPNNILLLAQFILPSFIFLIISIYYTIQKKDWFTISSICLALLSIYYFLTNRLYAHYYLISVCYIPIIILMLLTLRSKKDEKCLNHKKNSFVIVFITLIMALFTVLSIRETAWIGKKFLKSYQTDVYKTYNRDANQLAKKIKDRSSVAGYNLNSGWYLVTDIYPCYRYFTLQDWQSSFDQTLYHDITDCFTSGSAQYIVLQGDTTNIQIKNYIKEHYKLIGKMDSSIPANDKQIMLYEKNK